MEYKTHISWTKLMLVRDSGRPTVAIHKIMSSKDAYILATKTMAGYFAQHDREEFVVILLDAKNKMTAIHSVSVGSLSASIVHPREVFKMAILGNACAILLCHNHPSGDSTPSPEDIDITRRLVAAGDILGIKILDHIIIGDKEYKSFADLGLL